MKNEKQKEMKQYLKCIAQEANKSLIYSIYKMANLQDIANRRRHIADTYHKLRKIKSKVQRKAADIGFVKKAMATEVTPTFATSSVQKWSDVKYRI